MMIWVALFSPLLGSLWCGLMGRLLGKRLTGWIACASVFISFLLFSNLARYGEFDAILFNWLEVGSFTVELSVHLDSLSILMGLLVTGVGFLIHVYSIGYMAGDPNFSRYFAYLNLFIFFMLVLVTAGNLLLLFLGWEGVGLCSYLLISFWLEKKSAADAGKKAFIVNRIGDFGFLLGLFLLVQLFGTLSIGAILQAAPRMLSVGSLLATTVTLLLFCGAVGKSAQFPLYVWLPDAMEGPTPVSALIHAATMVTAGVYLVARLFPLFLLAPFTLTVMAWLGLFTAAYAGILAVIQSDIKKVLAYSTVSQLGYMFLALGVAAPVAAVFHLATHAFFKALLFLGAGSVIHALHGEQDLDKMGGLFARLPWTGITFLAAWLAIIGLPPFSGFFSKDEILLAAYHGQPFLWFLAWLTAGLTAFYMTRLFTLVFFKPNASRTVGAAHESPWVMVAPLCGLAFFSVVSGWIGWPSIQGSWIYRLLSPSLMPVNLMHPVAGGHPFSVPLALASSSLVVFASAAAWFLFRQGGTMPIPLYDFGKAFDRVNQIVLVGGGKLVAALCAALDHGIIDGFVNGVGWGMERISDLIRFWQNGKLRSYAFSFGIGVLAVVTLLLYWQGFFKFKGF